MKNTLIVVICVFANLLSFSQLSGQELLPINTTRHAVFADTPLDGELYRFTKSDKVVGFINDLSKKGVSKKDIMAFLNSTKPPPPNPSTKPSDNKDKIYVSDDMGINAGFDQAEKALSVNSLPFDNDPRLADLTLPSFPWPPPQCNTRHELPESFFTGLPTLKAINIKLRDILQQRGYSQLSYFSVPYSFALVTQLEQYNGTDASVRSDKMRWVEYPMREQFQGVMDYIKSFFYPQKAHFRLFVMIVTDQPFTSTGIRVTKEQAGAWLSQGVNRLPKNIAEMPYTEGYSVSALVYEFEVPESNRRPLQKCPAPHHDAKTHLVRAGILIGKNYFDYAI